jgi:hypothetical protein
MQKYRLPDSRQDGISPEGRGSSPELYSGAEVTLLQGRC